MLVGDIIQVTPENDRFSGCFGTVVRVEDDGTLIASLPIPDSKTAVWVQLKPGGYRLIRGIRQGDDNDDGLRLDQ